LLGAAFLVRAVLIFQGGQYYWPDERLYRVSQSAAECLAQADLGCAFRTLMRPEHTLFTVLGVIPALIEQYRGASARIPALFFAIFSVLSIWILATIARRLGADKREALLAAALLACSTTWTYYSRHLLPYDVSMAFALAALLVAVHKHVHFTHAWLCGAICGAAFLSYSGSWPLVGFVLLVPPLFGADEWRQRLRVAICVLAGFVVPVLALFVLSSLAGGVLLDDYLAFAATVTQGSFAEGWSLPLAYLWHAEHALALLWLGCLIAAAVAMPDGTRRSQIAVTGVVMVYGALVVMSVVAGVFVVYGRTARALVPLLCLLTAEQIHRVAGRYSTRPVYAIVLSAIALQAAVNLRVPTIQVFPDRFKQIARSASSGAFYVYADHIYPLPEPVSTDGAVVLAEAAHPLQYLPYQYEGFTPDQRRALRTVDIRMRLLER
jgi:hypothetical protein